MRNKRADYESLYWVYSPSVDSFKSFMQAVHFVYEFNLGNSRALTQRLLNAALADWDEHILVCANCPNRCLTDGFEITPMFDNLEKTGWPTV